jgi:hypothetical protein
MLQIVASLTDDSRSVIYDRNIFIKQAPGANVINLLTAVSYDFT